MRLPNYMALFLVFYLSITSSTSQTPALFTPDGQLKAIQYPNGRTITYTYDTQGNRLGQSISTSSNPLPIELLSFTAEPASNGTRHSELVWKTASERNSDRIDIEHSLDNANFQTVGTQKAAGNSSNEITYTFTHTSPAVGYNYYRLRLIDMDGSYSFSKTRVVTFQEELSFSIALYPNPTEGLLEVQLQTEGTGQLLGIKDMQGREQPLKAASKGKNQWTIDTSHLPSGTYVLSVKVGEARKAEEFVVR